MKIPLKGKKSLLACSECRCVPYVEYSKFGDDYIICCSMCQSHSGWQGNYKEAEAQWTMLVRSMNVEST